MSKIDRTRTVFIREGTPLPTTLSMDSERFLPGWRIVKNLDRQELTREIEGASWNFFYLAGEIRATVFGRDGVGTLRRAVKRILAKQEGQSFRFNSLEITKIASKWFLGIPLLRVTAHSRHIQLDIALIPAKDVLRRPLAAMPPARASHHGEVVPKQYAAVISSS
ncbi:MAG TPA: hypothetical protein VIH54_16395 [Chthoniobacterales bacterium]